MSKRAYPDLRRIWKGTEKYLGRYPFKRVVLYLPVNAENTHETLTGDEMVHPISHQNCITEIL